jgi:hypothetical protein
MQLLSGYMVTQSIRAVTEAGVPDALADGPLDVATLAERTHTNADALHRVLRALASVGIFHEVEAGRFALTPAGALLRTGVRGSMRDTALFFGGDMYDAWSHIGHSLRTGETAADLAFGAEHFEYMARAPEAAALFDRAMQGGLGARLPVLGARAWNTVRTVVDVGGGNGTLLATLLASQPHLEGVLFDRPHVAERGKERLAAEGLSGRCRVVGGDFFVSVPEGGDVYVLARVLHDWEDERAVEILRKVRAAMRGDATLFVLDDVVPEGDTPHPSKWIDLQMLVVTGGRERTRAEWEALLSAGGFRTLGFLERGRGMAVEAAPTSS